MQRALCGGDRAGLVLAGDLAVALRVQGHLVVVLLVDALDDIDLAVAGPAFADCPKGRPHAADGGGHVRKVGD